MSAWWRREILAERRAGTRHEMGTDWPLVDQLQEIRSSSGTSYIVLFGLCQGVPSSSRTFRWLSDALQYWS